MSGKWAIAVAPLTLLAGCGSSDEGKIRTEDGDVGYTVIEDGGSSDVRLSSPNGEASVASGEDLTPDLPAGLAVYPGAKVTSVTNVGIAAKGGAIVSMESSDSPEKLVAWYRAQAERAGFTIAGSAKAGALHMLSGKADDGREFALTASRRNDRTEAQLIAGIADPD